jgi:hypothetical protein
MTRISSCCSHFPMGSAKRVFHETSELRFAQRNGYRIRETQPGGHFRFYYV